MLGTALGLHVIRVIDLTQDTAGPYCTYLLGGFGAEVIKIEPPNTGDPSRMRGPFPRDEAHLERSAAFLYLNRNKSGVTLDLKNERGRRVFLELAQLADVIVESFGPGELASLGLDHATLKRNNPSIIITSVSDFGQTGPYSQFKGGELILDALGGWSYITGYPDREPLKPALFQAQYAAGLNAAIHTAAAINARQATGAGRTIDVSVLETAVHFVGSSIAQYGHTGGIQVRAGSWTGLMKGSSSPRSHPTEIYECKDGYIGVAVQTEGQWGMFAVLLNIPELKEDPRFATDYAGRGQYAVEMNRLVAPWFLERTRREIFDLFGEYRIPCGMVYATGEILEDPQHEAVGFFTELEGPDGQTLPYPGPPFNGADFPWRMGRAPRLGEHNSDVYTGLLGYSKEETARLSDKGVI